MMTLKLQSLLLLIGTLTFAACNNDDESPMEETPVPNYFPTSVGSYWVYDSYDIDGIAGTETLRRQNDTVFATGDTTIAGVVYQKFFGRPNAIQTEKSTYYTDSSGYVIQLGYWGRYLMSYANIDTVLSFYTLEVGMYSTSVKMEKLEGNLMLPAGNFSNVLNAQFRLYSFPDGVLIGKTNNYFAPGIGQLTRTIFYFGAFTAQQKYSEQRLVAYHIAP